MTRKRLITQGIVLVVLAVIVLLLHNGCEAPPQCGTCISKGHSAAWMQHMPTYNPTLKTTTFTYIWHPERWYVVLDGKDERTGRLVRWRVIMSEAQWNQTQVGTVVCRKGASR